MRRLDLDVTLRQGDFTLRVTHELALEGITALFGPSGAGKSTLLRVVAGFERGAAGRVAYDGTPWQESASHHFVAPHRRGVGVVFQDARLFGHLSVAGNLRFAARRSAGGNADITEEAVIAALDLAPLLGRRPASLSGGEGRRVAIGRALLARPDLLLMDEPLAGLDIRRKAAILPYIARLPEAFGLPVIYVTHAIGEVTRLADAMIALSAGRVTAAGPVAETFARLDLGGGGSRFEAGVILTATVTGHDPGYCLTRLAVAGQPLSMPAATVAPGETVQLRVRARDVMLATQRPEGLSARNILQGQVKEVIEEPDTAFAEVFVAVGDQTLRARVTRSAVAALDIAVGRSVFAVLKAISFDRRVL